MFRGPSSVPHKNGLSTKKKLSAEYAPLLRKRSPPGLQTNAPTIDADHFQRQAIAGLQHFLEHGDYMHLDKLMRTLVTVRHRTRFSHWCLRFARLSWDRKAELFRWDKGPRNFDIALARSTPIGIGNPRCVPAPMVIRPARVVTRRLSKCSVCGAPAMPGEDTCYGHMSG
jgi:hypothetical protein